MPSCEPCDRHWTPTSMEPDGSCPTCGRVLPVVNPGSAPEEAEAPSAPWHFKVLLVCLAVYLAWRGVRGVEWLAGRI